MEKIKEISKQINKAVEKIKEVGKQINKIETVEKIKEVSKQINKTKTEVYVSLLKRMFFSPPVIRNRLLKQLEKRMYSELVENEENYPRRVQEKKYEYLIAMLYSGLRNLDKNNISKDVAEKVVETLVRRNFMEEDSCQKIREKFKEKYGMYSPFIVLSPTQRCNLHCIGCYASSKIDAPSLSYEIVEKICDEVYNEWGSRFMTISGGEPFMYKDNGKTLFDIWKKYDEMFFLVYTNGTLINKENAKKLAEVGNVTPAISIEGFEEETDRRRGKGIFKRILKAIDNLKESGVPFGFSVTADKNNIETLLNDEFYDFAFLELGATHMWIFQLMPIGQAQKTKELMITPEQRVKLYRKWEYLLKEKKYCVADFWNSGVLSNGCIAYGRQGGYLYIDWNGNIMPCVFIPYYEHNIKDLYRQNKKLVDALFSDLFVRGRKWQCMYGLDNTKEPKNWLTPCSIRDHWVYFRENIISENSKPEDEIAKQALESEEYNKTLEEFDKELSEMMDPIWEKEYLERK